MPPVVAATCVLAVIAVIVHYTIQNIYHKLPLPPGPRGLPFLGIPYLMPKQQEWMTYHAWSQRYGSLMSFQVFGQTIVILSTAARTRELLDKRGSIYSDRPTNVMMELGGHLHWNLGLMPYSSKLRACRKLLSQTLSPQNVLEHHDTQTNSAIILLKQLLVAPERFPLLIRRATTRSIMKIFLGHELPLDGEDEFVTLIDEHMQRGTRFFSPAAYLVNTLPILQYLPSWCPGAGFKTEASDFRSVAEEVVRVPIRLHEAQQRTGSISDSFVSRNLSSIYSNDERENVQAAAATSYAAGVETTTTALTTFILAMTLYPDAQAQAQQEIDVVVGRDRLPTFEDKMGGRLPYLDALLKECLRWAPPGNLAVPHRLIEEDIIDGYRLPKGAIVIPNIWSILHNRARFAGPNEFVPERYVGEEVAAEDDSRNHVFGYGRRICPGRHLAEDSLWISIACILATYKISPARAADGSNIAVRPAFTSGVMSRPEDFICDISTRDDSARKLILSSSLGL